MTAMKSYLVTLEPLGDYFFGGEVTFGDAWTQNYLVRSNELPQQSALMGLIRYKILENNNLLSYDAEDQSTKELVADLIGENGVDVDNPATSYGVIKGISPVFLTDGKQYYTPTPLDHKIKEDKNDSNCPVREGDYNVSFGVSKCYWGKEIKNCLPEIKNYDQKNYCSYKYWSDDKGVVLKDSPFVYREQVGITKNDNSSDGKDAFFKQTLISLNYGMKFAFSVSIDVEKLQSKSKSLLSGSSMVFFGGNRSIFRMEIEEKSVDWSNIFGDLHKDGRLLCLGDALLSGDIRADSDFIWGMSKPWRFMKNSVSEKHSWGKPSKTNIYHLQSRGSVIFGKTEYLDDLKKSSLGLNIIGLNYFV